MFHWSELDHLPSPKSHIGRGDGMTLGALRLTWELGLGPQKHMADWGREGHLQETGVLLGGRGEWVLGGSWW